MSKGGGGGKANSDLCNKRGEGSRHPQICMKLLECGPSKEQKSETIFFLYTNMQYGILYNIDIFLILCAKKRERKKYIYLEIFNKIQYIHMFFFLVIS